MMQVATTATFSACGLEALRMVLADLEQPGGVLTSPIKAPLAQLLPVAIALFPVAILAGFAGALSLTCHLLDLWCCSSRFAAIALAAI